jgi:hypothetical protein
MRAEGKSRSRLCSQDNIASSTDFPGAMTVDHQSTSWLWASSNIMTALTWVVEANTMLPVNDRSEEKSAAHKPPLLIVPPIASA